MSVYSFIFFGLLMLNYMNFGKFLVLHINFKRSIKYTNLTVVVVLPRLNFLSESKLILQSGVTAAIVTMSF